MQFMTAACFVHPEPEYSFVATVLKVTARKRLLPGVTHKSLNKAVSQLLDTEINCTRTVISTETFSEPLANKNSHPSAIHVRKIAISQTAVIS